MSWVGTTGFAGGGGAWIADLGPYTGPSTGKTYMPPPSILETYGTAYDEIDYYIGDPTGGSLSGYTPPNLLDAYTFLNTSGSPTGGTRSDVSGYTGSHTGQHLYVALYPTHFPATLAGLSAPTMDPLSLVYDDMISGGMLPTSNSWIYSRYYRAWAYDCGTYIGPLPSAPPIPANLPIDVQQLDYYIGAPDGTVLAQGSSTFAPGDLSQTVDASRQWITPGDLTRAGSTTFAHDYGAVTSGAIHLLVVATSMVATTGDPPTTAPLSTIPASFASGGTGSPVTDPTTGAWSSNLSASTQSPITPAANWLTQTFTGGSNSAADVSQQQFIANAAAATTGVSHTTGTGRFLPACFGVDVFKASGVGNWLTSEMTLSLGSFGAISNSVAQSFRTYTAPATMAGSTSIDTLLAELGAPYSGWIEGLDYWALPGTNYEYFSYIGSTDSTFSSWAPIDFTITRSGENHNPAAQAYDSINFDLVRLVGAASPTAPITDTDGDLLDTFAITDAATQTDASYTGVDLGTNPTVTLGVRVHQTSSLAAPFPTPDLTSTQIGWGAQLNNPVSGGANANYTGALFHLWIPAPAVTSAGGYWGVAI